MKNTIKKVLIMFVALTVMLMPVAAFAEGGSGHPHKFGDKDITVTKTEKVYTAKAQYPTVTVKVNGVTLKKGTDYTLKYIKRSNTSKHTCTAPRNVMKHYNCVRVTGIGKYVGSVVDKNFVLTISKASQAPIKFSKTKATVKYSKVKRKAQSISMKYTPKRIPVDVSDNKTGKVTCKKVSGSKCLSVTKAGTIKVKKGTKRGTYKIKIKATAAATKNYKAAYKTSTVTVKVK